MLVKDLCNKHGFSEALYYLWRNKFGGMNVSEAKRLKDLEVENGRLKKLQLLENEVIKDALRKNGARTGPARAGTLSDRPGTERAPVAGDRWHERKRLPIRYDTWPDQNVELREMICALANRRKCYGVGMIHLKLCQAGHVVNYKRIERLYQETNLQMRRRKRKKVPPADRQPLLRPAAANEIWSINFVFDQTDEGRVIKCLTVVDDAMHEAVVVEVERVISGIGGTRVIDQLAVTPADCRE